jgi:hypothetical protein
VRKSKRKGKENSLCIFLCVYIYMEKLLQKYIRSPEEKDRILELDEE